MAVKPGPYDLTSTRLILGPQGNATPKQVTPDFYAELDREFSDFTGHVLISQARVRQTLGRLGDAPQG